MAQPALLKRKTLLMGQAHSGKTSMRSIIFAHWVARDTRKLGPTNQVEYSNVRFLGNLVLNLWDCGGQETFVENYLSAQERHVFSNVAVLMYVFDMEANDEEGWLEQTNIFRRCVVALCRNSPEAKVFCLVHKMDLVHPQSRAAQFAEKEANLRKVVDEAVGEYMRDDASEGTGAPPICANTACFATSIWDESLYRAWSAVVYSLVPQIDTLQRLTERFCELCEADEVVLFERQTFLTILTSRRAPEHRDEHRHEKVSNIIKQFKLSAMRLGTAVQSMEVTNSRFTAFVDGFSRSTYVMVVQSDKNIPASVTQMNIQIARNRFDDAIDHSPQLAGVL
eukprot:TRINITY_DN61054_c0_g1_i1.p1 TRINITY_DN61054_c0_g1~~TRINITY_DN61054_c0_g1_i1.p1  ORF type:complete len:337 (+),score=124.86 TRINITY_DN61054_c0_g1_i1:87-1097(+)